MVRFFSRPALPSPDDLCLVHSPPPEPPQFLPGPGGLWRRRDQLPDDLALRPGLFLGEASPGVALWAIEAPRPPDAPWTTLRQVVLEGVGDQARAACRASELAFWRSEHRFCGACGSPTRHRDGQFVLECPGCGAEAWPRVTPAVIMLVHRGDEILLARHARHARPGAPSFHTTLAGFVESAETLEEAVAREVFEEVAVRTGPPVYIGSQAWPFPHSLMVGFHAPWASGEPVPDGDEIVEARWYRRDRLPEIPLPGSIARHLIRTYFHDPDL